MLDYQRVSGNHEKPHILLSIELHQIWRFFCCLEWPSGQKKTTALLPTLSFEILVCHPSKSGFFYMPITGPFSRSPFRWGSTRRRSPSATCVWCMVASHRRRAWWMPTSEPCAPMPPPGAKKCDICWRFHLEVWFRLRFLQIFLKIYRYTCGGFGLDLFSTVFFGRYPLVNQHNYGKTPCY